MSVEVVIRCLTCQARYNVTKYPAGLRVKCKKCGQTLVVPPTAANVSHLAEEEQQVVGTMMFDASSLASTLPPTTQKPTVDAKLPQPEPGSDFPDFPSAPDESPAPLAPPPDMEPEPGESEPAAKESTEEAAEEPEEETAKPEKKISRFSHDRKDGKSGLKERRHFGQKKDKDKDPLANIDEEKSGRGKFGRDKKGKGKFDRHERKGRHEQEDGEDAPKSKKKLFIIIGAVALVGILAGVYFMFLSGPKPEFFVKEINSKFSLDKDTLTKLPLLGTLKKQKETAVMDKGKLKVTFELLGGDNLKTFIADKNFEIAAAVSESLINSETGKKYKELCESFSSVGGDKNIWTVTINCDPKKLSALLKTESDWKQAKKDLAVALEEFDKVIKKKVDAAAADEKEDAKDTEEKKPEGDGKDDKKPADENKTEDGEKKTSEAKTEEKSPAPEEKKTEEDSKKSDEESKPKDDEKPSESDK